MVGSTPQQVIGWDLGGAHLKAVVLDEHAAVRHVLQRPCPLWQGLDRLMSAFEQISKSLTPGISCIHAVTMTGELVDLFASREDGVRELLKALKHQFPSEPVFLFTGDRRLKPIAEILASDYDRIASANWLASGLWLAAQREEAVFIDIGSTTTDILAIQSGAAHYRGYSDTDRLAAEELIYAGVVRTPLMALVDQAPIQGRWEKPMAEHFATTADVYRLTGELQESDDQYPAADGGEKSPVASARRLARQFGRDYDDLQQAGWVRLATAIRSQQIAGIAAAVSLQDSLGRVSDTTPLVGAGIGRFLVEALAKMQNRPYIDYAAFLPMRPERLEFEVSDCAPAAAVAGLLMDQLNTSCHD